jgi:hypothetical protein
MDNNIANRIKSWLPDILAILLFIIVSFAYFFPADTEGRMLNSQDNTAAFGSGQEANQYHQRTGERTRWTNSIFGGMPTYQMGPAYSSTDKLHVAERVYQLYLPDYVKYLFISLLGFFILLRAFNFKTWMAALGSILWAFSSYFLIIIAAGHMWKVMALAYIPPTIAGMVLAYRGKYLWGFLTTAFFAALQINANHPQMTYYFLFVVLLMFVAYAIDAVRKHTMARFCKATGVLAAAAIIGVCINISNLYHTYEYSKETMRSKSELVQTNKEDAANQTKSGLSRDYITQWSYGVGETWSLLVPNVKGGASVPMSENARAMKKADSQFTSIYQQVGQYWGEQPGTAGPVYVGAFVLMLFILGLFIVKGPMKWCLLAATLLSIVLSWGRNCMGFTDFFLDYVPMYDKFRAVSSILVIAEFTIPLLAMMALKELVDKPEILKGRLKFVYISAALTGGIAFLFGVMPHFFFDNYISSSETQMFGDAVQKGYIPSDMLGSILSNLTDMRTAIFTADCWRSFWIVVVGLLLILLFNVKKLKAPYFVGAVLVLCLVDLWDVDKRYLSDKMFVEPTQRITSLAKTPTDNQILTDASQRGLKDYRVLNFSTNTFNENNTSYWHKSVGGYHPAKLRRYQEMIEHHIAPEMGRVQKAVIAANGDLTKVRCDSLSPVLNMLNTAYYIFPISENATTAIPNPGANGNAWFVSDVRYVNNANEEIEGLNGINTRHTAIVDNTFKSKLSGAPSLSANDSSARATLTSYEPNDLRYEVTSDKGGVVVFAEIYYPEWTATLDGRPIDIARADYILRAIGVPAGKHQVEFKFDPVSLHKTEAAANVSLIILLLAVLLAVAEGIRQGRRGPKQTADDNAETEPATRNAKGGKRP